MKAQEGSVYKYLNFRNFQSYIGFSVDHNYHITELVNKQFSTGKFRKVDTTFSIESTHEKEVMAALPLTGHAHHTTEMEYNGNSVHTIVRI